VRRFARAPGADELLVKATSLESKLDPHKAWLGQRRNEGITDAIVLHAGLRARGWAGSVLTVRRYVRPVRQLPAAPPPRPGRPQARQITSWLLARPASLAGIRARCPHLGTLAAHVSAFAEMMTGLHGRDLESWLADVEAGEQPRRGERQPNKTIKRQMYGRASFALLRKGVLLAT
jgi:hypothetical protein